MSVDYSRFRRKWEEASVICKCATAVGYLTLYCHQTTDFQLEWLGDIFVEFTLDLVCGSAKGYTRRNNNGVGENSTFLYVA